MASKRRVAPKRGGLLHAPDVRRMALAARAFLEACGLDLSDPDLAMTPVRVAKTWREELLDGYALDPEVILARAFPHRGGGPIVVHGVRFTSLCPHHLLPVQGTAAVAYVPQGKIVGFSQIVRLVDCFSHRLSLQERTGEEIVSALVRLVGARGAACVLDAEHTCVTVRGPRRSGTRIRTESYAGRARWRSDLLKIVRDRVPRRHSGA